MEYDGWREEGSRMEGEEIWELIKSQPSLFWEAENNVL